MEHDFLSPYSTPMAEQKTPPFTPDDPKAFSKANLNICACLPDNGWGVWSRLDGFPECRTPHQRLAAIDHYLRARLEQAAAHIGTAEKVNTSLPWLRSIVMQEISALHHHQTKQGLFRKLPDDLDRVVQDILRLQKYANGNHANIFHYHYTAGAQATLVFRPPSNKRAAKAGEEDAQAKPPPPQAFEEIAKAWRPLGVKEALSGDTAWKVEKVTIWGQWVHEPGFPEEKDAEKKIAFILAYVTERMGAKILPSHGIDWEQRADFPKGQDEGAIRTYMTKVLTQRDRKAAPSPIIRRRRDLSEHAPWLTRMIINTQLFIKTPNGFPFVFPEDLDKTIDDIDLLLKRGHGEKARPAYDFPYQLAEYVDQWRNYALTEEAQRHFHRNHVTNHPAFIHGAAGGARQVRALDYPQRGGTLTLYEVFSETALYHKGGVGSERWCNARETTNWEWYRAQGTSLVAVHQPGGERWQIHLGAADWRDMRDKVIRLEDLCERFPASADHVGLAGLLRPFAEALLVPHQDGIGLAAAEWRDNRIALARACRSIPGLEDLGSRERLQAIMQGPQDTDGKARLYGCREFIRTAYILSAPDLQAAVTADHIAYALIDTPLSELREHQPKISTDSSPLNMCAHVPGWRNLLIDAVPQVLNHLAEQDCSRNNSHFERLRRTLTWLNDSSRHFGAGHRFNPEKRPKAIVNYLEKVSTDNLLKLIAMENAVLAGTHDHSVNDYLFDELKKRPEYNETLCVRLMFGFAENRCYAALGDYINRYPDEPVLARWLYDQGGLGILLNSAAGTYVGDLSGLENDEQKWGRTWTTDGEVKRHQFWHIVQKLNPFYHRHFSSRYKAFDTKEEKALHEKAGCVPTDIFRYILMAHARCGYSSVLIFPANLSFTVGGIPAWEDAVADAVPDVLTELMKPRSRTLKAPRTPYEEWLARKNGLKGCLSILSACTDIPALGAKISPELIGRLAAWNMNGEPYEEKDHAAFMAALAALPDSAHALPPNRGKGERAGRKSRKKPAP